MYLLLGLISSLAIVHCRTLCVAQLLVKSAVRGKRLKLSCYDGGHGKGCQMIWNVSMTRSSWDPSPFVGPSTNQGRTCKYSEPCRRTTNGIRHRCITTTRSPSFAPDHARPRCRSSVGNSLGSRDLTWDRSREPGFWAVRTCIYLAV